MPETRILIVEDSGIIALDIQDSLRLLGYTVTDVAVSKEEAIRKAAETHPDLVLMDIKLGSDMSGIEAANHIRIHFGLPVVYLTAHADEDTLRQAKATAPYGYMLKPFETKELRTTIELALYKHQLEEKIRRRARELEALNEIGRIITSSLDLKETLAQTTEQITQLLGVEATALLLCDEAGDELWFAATSGQGASEVLNQRLAMGQGIAGWVAQHAEAALVPDVSQDPRWFSGMDAQSGFGTRSILAVPLQSKGRTVGVIEVMNKHNGPFDQEDVWLLSSLAAPAATAIENARLFEQVRSGREQLQALSGRLVEVQEAERRHIARELHDETGQALSSLLLGLSLMEKEAHQPQAVIARALELEVLADGMLENLHRLAMNLRPASLDHLGLIPALEQYITSFGEQHGLDVQFEALGLAEDRLPSSVETAVYRVVQEALTNIARHARASHVDVLLERRGERLLAIIEDDGVGFEVEEAMQTSRLGLVGMRERARALGGTLTIESAPGAGTTVFVEVPYDDSHLDC